MRTDTFSSTARPKSLNAADAFKMVNVPKYAQISPPMRCYVDMNYLAERDEPVSLLVPGSMDILTLVCRLQGQAVQEAHVSIICDAQFDNDELKI